MSTLKEGAIYLKGIKRWPVAAEYNFIDGRHEIRMFESGLTREAISHFRTGNLEIRVCLIDGVLWLVWGFGGEEFFLSSFSLSRIPSAQRLRPNKAPPSQTLHVIVVDADTNRVQVLRRLPMSVDFTLALNDLICQQDNLGLKSFEVGEKAESAMRDNLDSVIKELTESPSAMTTIDSGLSMHRRK